MFFLGRSFDTFEYALFMLSDIDRIDEHIDVLTGRAFALECSNGEALFSCVQNVDETIEALNHLYSGAFYTVDPINTKEPFIIELKKDIGLPTISRKYYPFGHYVYCVREGENMRINDPDGFPCLSVHSSNLDYDGSIGIAKARGDITLKFDIRDVVLRGREIINDKPSADIDVSDRIFLQYAKRNYIIQTNKILNFLCHYVEETKRVEQEFSELFSSFLAEKTYSNNSIVQIRERLFELIGGLTCAQI